MSTMPCISVVMPARNAGPTIDAALGSLLKQSLLPDEIIIVDDCSTDNTAERIRRLDEPRIKLLRNDAQQGVARSLNRAIGASSGDLIARMDADDVSAPSRFEMQRDFLRSHPEVSLVGSWVRCIDARSKMTGRLDLPTSHAAICGYATLSPPFRHPAVMLRRSCIENLEEIYDAGMEGAEDYDLWARLLPLHRAANLPFHLLDYRVHPRAVSVEKRASQVEVHARAAHRFARTMTGRPDLDPSVFQSLAEAVVLRKAMRPADLSALSEIIRHANVEIAHQLGGDRAFQRDAAAEQCRILLRLALRSGPRAVATLAEELARDGLLDALRGAAPVLAREAARRLPHRRTACATPPQAARGLPSEPQQGRAAASGAGGGKACATISPLRPSARPQRPDESATVSVVVPVRNRADLLRRSVTSALNQSAPILEIIIVDDASSDDTVAVARDLERLDRRVRVLQEVERGGACVARNRGIVEARGTHVAFLDSDDRWRPEKISAQLDALRRSPLAIACFTGADHVADGRVLARRWLPADVQESDLYAANILGSTSSAMVRRDDLMAVGMFDPRMVSCQDWDLYLRLIRRGRFAIVPAPLTMFDDGDHLRISRDAAAVIEGHRMMARKIVALQSDRSTAKKLGLQHAFKEVDLTSQVMMAHRAAFRAGVDVLRNHPNLKSAVMFAKITYRLAMRLIAPRPIAPQPRQS